MNFSLHCIAFYQNQYPRLLAFHCLFLYLSEIYSSNKTTITHTKKKMMDYLATQSIKTRAFHKLLFFPSLVTCFVNVLMYTFFFMLDFVSFCQPHIISFLWVLGTTLSCIPAQNGVGFPIIRTS